MTDQIRSDDTGGAYSNATLEHSFQAYLDVAASFHCEVIDFLHHRLVATSLDDNTRFFLAMDCEDAHRHLVNAWDPDHGELSRMSLVQAYVPKPERANGRSLINNPLKSH